MPAGSRDWSLGQRLGLGFALTLLLLTALAGAMYRWSAQSAAAHDELETRIAPRLHAAQTLELKLLAASLGARNWALEPTPATDAFHEQQVMEARAALRKLMALPREAADDALLRELAPQVEGYLSLMEGVVGGNAARPQLPEELRTLRARHEPVTDLLSQFTARQQREQAAELEQIEAARRAASEGSALAVGMALLLFGAVAFVTVRSIREPARRLLEGAAALERGDWGPASTWASSPGARAQRDEMKQLAHAFGTAARALERREQRLRTDQRIAIASGAGLSKDAIAAAALTAVCEYAHADAGALFLLNERELVPVAVRGAAVGAELAARVMKEQRSLEEGSMAAVPLKEHGQVVGALLVAAVREPDAGLVRFLEEAALQLGVGLENVRAYEQIHALVFELGQQGEQIQAQNVALQRQNEALHSQGEEIKAQNEELRHSEEQLRAHGQELATVDQRRREFLAFLAHELRNPLAAISNSLYVLLNSRIEATVRDRAEQVIARQTRQLARLVDDLLDVTRISSGKMRLRMDTLDLCAVARECVEDGRGRAEQAGLKLELELPPHPVLVRGDQSRLTQVLGNLLDNALKFGGADQPVRVRLRAEPGQQAELTVEDGGMGIDAAVLARLFQPFSQADTSLSHRRSGLGLGLSLVKAVIELHGGSVQAHSEGLGRGSRFTLMLPTVAEPRAGAPLATSPRASVPRRVLIIEDNADAALAMRDSMELSGHEARTASSGAAGLEEARTFQPHVVLCDLGLPGMDGYEVARRFRADERLRHLYLVALSGYATEADRQRAEQAGFDRHLAKPPDIEALERLIDELPLTEAHPSAARRAPF